MVRTRGPEPQVRQTLGGPHTPHLGLTLLSPHKQFWEIRETQSSLGEGASVTSLSEALPDRQKPPSNDTQHFSPCLRAAGCACASQQIVLLCPSP